MPTSRFLFETELCFSKALSYEFSVPRTPFLAPSFPDSVAPEGRSDPAPGGGREEGRMGKTGLSGFHSSPVH